MARFDQIVALLLAGGHGCRIHSDRPKQFMEVAGIPVIAYTMRTLQEHPDVDAVYVVCAAEWEDFVRETARVAGVDKLRGTFPAGGTSLQSVKNGVEGLGGVYGGRNPVVLTHEAVRPLLSREMIDCNLRTFHAYGNAITAVRSNEAYMVSEDGTSSRECIPRERLYRAQTPQTFYLDDLTEAFREATRKGMCDSQSLYTFMSDVFPGRALHIAPGSELNFKLTVPEDFDTLEAILSYRHIRRRER